MESDHGSLQRINTFEEDKTNDEERKSDLDEEESYQILSGVEDEEEFDAQDLEIESNNLHEI